MAGGRRPGRRGSAHATSDSENFLNAPQAGPISGPDNNSNFQVRPTVSECGAPTVTILETVRELSQLKPAKAVRVTNSVKAMLHRSNHQRKFIMNSTNSGRRGEWGT